jgi:hypothetical protein
MTGGPRARLAVLLALAATAAAGCGEAVCPAIGYSSSVTVRLDHTWPDRDALVVTVRCAEDDQTGCDLAGEAAGPEWVGTGVSTPSALEAEVTRDGTVIATLDVAPEFEVVERPHGPWCGGPAAAEVTLAPIA